MTGAAGRSQAPAAGQGAPALRSRLPGGRWAVLLPLLALAGALALFGDKTPPGGAAPRPQARSPAPTAAATGAGATGAARPAPTVAAARAGGAPTPSRGAAAEPIQALMPRVAGASPAPVADLFQTAAWRQRPAPPSAAAAPPVATAASMPVPPPDYRLIGKQHDGQQWLVFLGRGEASFIARVGDTIETTWRVDQIDPPSMTLTHLPSGQTQRLAIGDAR